MAKRLRKNNNNIKNQAESLNVIAREHNKDSWQDLINDSVLLIDSEELSCDNTSNNDNNFRFSEKITSMFGIMVSTQLIKLRSNTRIDLSKTDSQNSRIHAIYNMADLLHNVGSLMDTSNKDMLRLRVEHHKLYFEKVLSDDASLKETEIDMIYGVNFKEQLVSHKYWINLFDEMLKELDL